MDLNIHSMTASLGAMKQYQSNTWLHGRRKDVGPQPRQLGGQSRREAQPR